MKEFDLQKALAGEKVVTRDGRDVKILGYNEKMQDQVIGWIDGMAYGWNMYGQFNNPEENSADLFMTPTERNEWIVRIENSAGEIKYEGPFYKFELAEKMLYYHEMRGMKATWHLITIIE